MSARTATWWKRLGPWGMTGAGAGVGLMVALAVLGASAPSSPAVEPIADAAPQRAHVPAPPKRQPAIVPAPVASPVEKPEPVAVADRNAPPPVVFPVGGHGEGPAPDDLHWGTRVNVTGGMLADSLELFSDLTGAGGPKRGAVVGKDVFALARGDKADVLRVEGDAVCVEMVSGDAAKRIGWLLRSNLRVAAFQPPRPVRPRPARPQPVAEAREDRPAPAREDDSGVVRVGSRVFVNLPNADFGPWIATSDDAWDEMIDAQNAGSMALMRRLTDRGKVLRVRNGTRAIVVKTAFTSVFIRLTDGPFEGSEGWIQREFVSRRKP